MLETKKRRQISLETKLEIIQLYNNDTRPIELAKKFDFPLSTVLRIIKEKNQEDLLKYVKNNAINSSTKRLKTSRYDKLNKALDEWFEIFIVCMKLKDNTTFMIMRFLSVSDIITLYFWNLNQVADSLFNLDLLNYNLYYCKFLQFSQFTSLQISAWMLVLICFDRYLTISSISWKTKFTKANGGFNGNYFNSCNYGRRWYYTGCKELSFYLPIMHKYHCNCGCNKI